MMCTLKSCSSSRLGRCLACAAWTWLAVASSVRVHAADSTKRISWLTAGPLKQQLELPAQVSWTDQTLRGGLTSLSRAKRVAFLLDRRVDPGQTLELELSDVPLAEALGKIAEASHCSYRLLGTVAYFGPESSARVLRTLAALRVEESRHARVELRNKLLARRGWQWDDLATPRELLDMLAKEAGITIEGLDQVPHDLWAAGDLPSLTWAERLSLIAVQFDLTFEIDAAARRVKLMPIDPKVTIEKTYSGGGDALGVAKRYAQLIPGAEIRVEGKKVMVRALLEEHEGLAGGKREPAANAPPVTVAIGKIARLNVKQIPLRGVLNKLSKTYKLEFKIDEAALKNAGISLDQRVTFEVQDVTLDEALEAALGPVGLKFVRDDTQVTISPAK